MSLQTRQDYDEARKYLDEITWKRDNLHGSDSFTHHMRMQCDLMSRVLLAYRRQNNIFEIGDLVVTTHEDSNPRLRKIVKFDGLYHLEHVNKNPAIESNYRIQLCRKSTFRMATDIEIAQGCRE